MGSTKRAAPSAPHADWRLPESESKPGTIVSFFRRKAKPAPASEEPRREPPMARRAEAPAPEDDLERPADELDRPPPPPWPGFLLDVAAMIMATTKKAAAPPRRIIMNMGESFLR